MSKFAKIVNHAQTIAQMIALLVSNNKMVIYLSGPNGSGKTSRVCEVEDGIPFVDYVFLQFCGSELPYNNLNVFHMGLSSNKVFNEDISKEALQDVASISENKKVTASLKLVGLFANWQKKKQQYSFFICPRMKAR